MGPSYTFVHNVVPDKYGIENNMSVFIKSLSVHCNCRQRYELFPLFTNNGRVN